MISTLVPTNFTPLIAEGVVLILVGAFVVFGVYRLLYLFRRLSFGNADAIVRAWDGVTKLTQNGDATAWRLAVVNADAVLDMALQTKGFPGDRFASRLMFAAKKYRNLRSVWWAHNLRNTLAHEPTAALSVRDARRAVTAFHTALRELGAL